MMRALRRYLILATFIFWQGGFTFYAAVVVPVGTDVLGTARAQGWITQRVTHYLNLSGAFAVAALGWDVAVSGDPSWRRRQFRWLALAGLAVPLVVLIWLHSRLDALVDHALDHIQRGFRPLHRTYLWISTVQWACGLVFLFLTLRAWQGEDGRQARSSVSVPQGDTR